jgi:mono/diheme cytochrome c family protein
MLCKGSQSESKGRCDLKIPQNIVFIAFLAGATLLYGQSADRQFQQNCKQCHGDDGKGRTIVGRIVLSADLTSNTVSKKSDAELAMVISNGKGKMPAFGPQLGGNAGVATMLSHVRSLRK